MRFVLHVFCDLPCSVKLSKKLLSSKTLTPKCYLKSLENSSVFDKFLINYTNFRSSKLSAYSCYNLLDLYTRCPYTTHFCQHFLVFILFTLNPIIILIALLYFALCVFPY